MMIIILCQTKIGTVMKTNLKTRRVSFCDDDSREYFPDQDYSDGYDY